MQAAPRPLDRNQRWKRLALGGTALFVVALLLSVPVFRGTSEQNPGARNLSHLQKVGAACRLYAMDFRGAYPDALASLDPDYLSTLGQQSLRYFDPISRVRHSWLYFPGYSAQSPPGTIILAAPLAAANGRRLVYRTDGSSSTISETDYRAALDAQQTQ